MGHVHPCSIAMLKKKKTKHGNIVYHYKAIQGFASRFRSSDSAQSPASGSPCPSRRLRKVPSDAPPVASDQLAAGDLQVTCTPRVMDGASSLENWPILGIRQCLKIFHAIMGIMEQHEYVETIIIYIYICACVYLFIMHIQPLNYSHKVPPLNSLPLSPSLHRHLRERSHRLNYPPPILQYPQMVYSIVIGLWHDRVYHSTTMWCHSYVCWLITPID